MATTPTSASDAETLLLANLDYDVGTGSLAKAQQVVVAGRAWLIFNPSRATHGGRGGEEIQLNVDAVEDMINRALEWIIANQSGGKNRFLVFNDYRT